MEFHELKFSSDAPPIKMFAYAQACLFTTSKFGFPKLAFMKMASRFQTFCTLNSRRGNYDVIRRLSSKAMQIWCDNTMLIP